MEKEEKKKQQLCAFITLLQAMGYDIIAVTGNSFKPKEKEIKHESI